MNTQTPQIISPALQVLFVALATVGPSSMSAQVRLGDTAITRTGIGPVGISASEAELVTLLGRDVVRRGQSFRGEGFCAPGTRIFPGTPEEIVVTWTDTTFTSIMELAVQTPNAPWRTPQGVGIGTTLKELEAITRAPVQFSGFGWDYGGILGWTEMDFQTSLRLAPTTESYAAASNDQRLEISGDKLVSSDHPLVRTMTIVVQEIVLPGPGRGGVEYECPQAQ